MFLSSNDAMVIPVQGLVGVPELRNRIGVGVLGCIILSSIGHSAVKTVEMLDERTGMTVGALLHPLAFTETGLFDLLEPEKQPSVLYVGPVEWDRSGDLSYLLWVQVAPGVGGHRLDDIRGRGALRLELDDGPAELSPLDEDVLAGSPYHSIAPVGQTAYFTIDVPLLRRMAASHKIGLYVRAGDLTMVDFVTKDAVPAALRQFITDRGVVD